MIPENRLSTEVVDGAFLAPDDDSTIALLVDWERGGVNLNDPSQGLRVKYWKFYYDGTGIFCMADDVAPVLLVTAEGVTEISGTFDQNMRPCVAYMQGGECHLNWWDTWDSARKDDVFPGQISPRVALDDKRSSQFGVSDIIFGYIRDNTLCYRQQRDRYTVERVLSAELPDGVRLRNIGMTIGWRLKFDLG